MESAEKKLCKDSRCLFHQQHGVCAFFRTHSSYFFSSQRVDRRRVDSEDFARETEEFLFKFAECDSLYPTLECAMGQHMNISAQEKVLPF